jgi:hypothetical protein
MNPNAKRRSRAVEQTPLRCRVLRAHADASTCAGRDRVKLDRNSRLAADDSRTSLRGGRTMLNAWAWDHDDDEGFDGHDHEDDYAGALA